MAALTGLVRGAAIDLAPRAITVNNVQPGPTATDMTSALAELVKPLIPLKRMGDVIGGRQLRLLPRVGRSGLHHRSQPYHRRRIRRIIGKENIEREEAYGATEEFDQEKALRKAIRLFSQQGFAATSTDDLMRVMEVGRQSMYDTFGDKRALFLKALELYVTESVHSINVELEKPGRPSPPCKAPW